jgi:Zn ribbon nucleic-acid-binding protein
MRYESAGQRCPKCRRSFRTLADEAGQHECPHCGYAPWHVDEQDDDAEIGETQQRPDAG